MISYYDYFLIELGLLLSSCDCYNKATLANLQGNKECLIIEAFRKSLKTEGLLTFFENQRSENRS